MKLILRRQKKKPPVRKGLDLVRLALKGLAAQRAARRAYRGYKFARRLPLLLGGGAIAALVARKALGGGKAEEFAPPPATTSTPTPPTSPDPAAGVAPTPAAEAVASTADPPEGGPAAAPTPAVTTGTEVVEDPGMTEEGAMTGSAPQQESENEPVAEEQDEPRK